LISPRRQGWAGILSFHNAEIAFTIKGKDSKIGAGKARNPGWPFASVNLVITIDEFLVTREMANPMQGRFSTLDTPHLEEVYLLLSYDPRTQDRSCVHIK